MMTKEVLTERFNEIMSFDHQTPVEDMELKYICSNLGAIAEIENLNNNIKLLNEAIKEMQIKVFNGISIGVDLTNEIEVYKAESVLKNGLINQYKDEIEKLKAEAERLKKATLFVQHIETHLTELGLNNVMCKICNKTIDEIASIK